MAHVIVATLLRRALYDRPRFEGLNGRLALSTTVTARVLARPVKRGVSTERDAEVADVATVLASAGEAQGQDPRGALV